MFAFLFLILVIPFINGQLQPCKDVESVELKNPIMDDNILVYNGVRFPPKYVYSKNVSGEIKTFGCVCQIRKCFRKCCEFGYVMYNRTCTLLPELNTIYNDGVTINYLQTFKSTVRLQSSHFYTLFGKPCIDMYYETSWYLQEDGNLYIESPHSISSWISVGPDNYCIDNFVKEIDGENITNVDAIVCYDNEEERDLSDYFFKITCMLVSCVFILLTVGVYIWLPKLHNVHGRILTAYLMCLFVGFLFMAVLQLLVLYKLENKKVYESMSFIFYFSLLSAFFWLNVMCYDIWRVFSGKRDIRPQKQLVWAQIRSYSLYAFGIPTILTVLLICLEYSDLPPNPFLPSIRLEGRFLTDEGKLLYLYGPMLILCVANIVLFVLTAVKIAMTRKETSVLSSGESSRHDQSNDKQTLLLYVKLFILMGISWIFEIISALYPSYHWRVSDIYNALIGLVIFIIFVCKRQIFDLLKERIKEKFQQCGKGDLNKTNRINSVTHTESQETIESSVAADIDIGEDPNVISTV